MNFAKFVFALHDTPGLAKILTWGGGLILLVLEF